MSRASHSSSKKGGCARCGGREQALRSGEAEMRSHASCGFSQGQQYQLLNLLVSWQGLGLSGLNLFSFHFYGKVIVTDAVVLSEDRELVTA